MSQTIINVNGKLHQTEYQTPLADASDIYDTNNQKSVQETLNDENNKIALQDNKIDILNTAGELVQHPDGYIIKAYNIGDIFYKIEYTRDMQIKHYYVAKVNGYAGHNINDTEKFIDAGTSSVNALNVKTTIIKESIQGDDAYGVYVKQWREEHPSLEPTSENGFLEQDEWLESLIGDSAYEVAKNNDFEGSERDWLEYIRGKSAKEIYEKEYNTTLTDRQFIEKLKANYPMKRVKYDEDNYNVDNPTTIDDISPSDETEGKLWFMPNYDNTETKLFISVNDGTAEVPNYKWYNMGVVNIPNNALTEEMVDNECSDGAINKPASAKVVMDLKAKLEGVTASEMKGSTNLDYNGFIVCKTLGEDTEKTYKYSNIAHTVFIPIPQDTKKLRFLGRFAQNNTIITGYAFINAESQEDIEENIIVNSGTKDITDYIVELYPWENNGTPYNTEINNVVIPDEATYFCAIYGTGDITQSNFYCYFQNGKSVLEMISEMIPDVVDNLNSTATDKALSANQGKVLNENIIKIDNALKHTCDYSLISGDTLNYGIGLSNKNWYQQNNVQCIISPIKIGDTLTIKSHPAYGVQYGFLTDDYSEPVVGESAPLVNGELFFLNTTSTPETERTHIIPNNAKYLYVKLRESTRYFYPEAIEIKPNKQIIYDSYYAGDSYDTYIEENIIYRYTSLSNWCYKYYKVESGIDYKVVIFVQPGQNYAVRFFSETMTELSSIWGNNGSSIMFKGIEDDLEIPQGTKYIGIVFQKGPASSSSYTDTGCGALMRPLQYDDWTPTNQNIYCVSKILKPSLPYNYQTENSTFEQSEIWSAWSFMYPSNYRGDNAKPYPIASFFHGSSGFLTSEVMGYNTANTSEGIVGSLLQKGFIVFDINGYGISMESDDYSKHWGCPSAVATVKKAYTILTERFNGKKGMVISGISMGGAIAKSYCMIYPEDVVACALEAPSEIGCTIRILKDTSTTIVKNGTISRAWDAWDNINNKLDMNMFVGYSPLINPQLIDENGHIVHKGIDEWTLSDWIDVNVGQYSTKPATNMQLYSSFPVEIVIWHGDADLNVDLGYSQQFIRTIRNAGCNGKLRVCPNCEHNLNTYNWVMDEVVNYIIEKLSC